MTGDTLGLAPLGGGCGPAIYCYPDYDSLIYETAAGQFEPDLATSWQFTDATHQTLLVNLRQGVYFTDGSELTGAAAAASINAFRSAPGPLAGNAYPIDSVTADGKYAVKIHYSTASTLDHALSQLTPQNSIGAIVGPAGVKNPASLNTTSDGIGAYTLDAAQTTAGSHYTYTANPRYFNKAAVRYRTVVMMPMADQSSRLSAVQSGQIDWAQGLTATQAESAQSSGLQVSTGSLGRSPQGVTMLVLANRASGPLTSLDVRQAIQYAVPRQQVTKVVYGEGATATSSITAQGDEGYAPGDTGMYPYDVTKAKQLLAAAGYPNGITISVLDATFMDPGNTLGQALAAALEPVGITLNLVATNAPPGSVVQEIGSRKYDAFIWDLVGGTYTDASFEFAPKGGIINPFGMPADSQLMGLIRTAALAPITQQDTLMQAATKRLDTLSWVIPVSDVPTQQALSGRVRNVPKTFSTYELDPFGPVAADAFYSAGS